jgi:hypothetical protein
MSSGHDTETKVALTNEKVHSRPSPTHRCHAEAVRKRPQPWSQRGMCSSPGVLCCASSKGGLDDRGAACALHLTAAQHIGMNNGRRRSTSAMLWFPECATKVGHSSYPGLGSLPERFFAITCATGHRERLLWRRLSSDSRGNRRECSGKESTPGQALQGVLQGTSYQNLQTCATRGHPLFSNPWGQPPEIACTPTEPTTAPSAEPRAADNEAAQAPQRCGTQKLFLFKGRQGRIRPDMDSCCFSFPFSLFPFPFPLLPYPPPSLDS